MCGLTGLLSFSPDRLAVDGAMLATMRDTMAHRGPDGAGLWVSDDRRIGLAHRRLSIIDLSDAAAQPMRDAGPDGRDLWIAYNGEVYNHRELRAELTALGHTDWQTDHSDTEVILKAYRQWGIDCLHRLRGMFAIALWDGAAETLWLVRDRIGIKPLYYAIDERGIAFGSEIKAILAGPPRERAVDEEALFHYLSFLATPAPKTLFRGINKLAAGTVLKVGADGTVEERRWWDALDGLPAAPTDDGALDATVMETLRQAVRYRKEADVPVGVFLSGGVDSSTNLALFSEDGGQAKAFSITYPADQASVADEMPYARQIAAQVGADHHVFEITQRDLMDFLPRMIALQDEPIADPVCVPVHFVSKLARDSGVVVCQVGEGADELFWGYRRWRAYLRLQHLNDLPVPRTLKRLGVALLRAVGGARWTVTELLRRGAVGQPIFWGGAEAFTEAEKADLLSPRLRAVFRNRTSWDAVAPIRARFDAAAKGRSALNWMTYLDLNLRLPELLLMRVDKMTMGNSIEARVPYLDHHFVQLALAVPETTKTRSGELKHVLKRAVRGLIPDAIIDRPKQGFAVPVDDWSRSELGAHARDALATFCAETDLLDGDAVARVLDHGSARQAWYLMNLALWWEAYIRPFSSHPSAAEPA